MRKIVVFFAILFLILLCGVVFLYFYLEKPKQEESNIYANVVNFSIYATDEGENVKTGYVVSVNGKILSTGETLEDAPIIESVLTNSTVLIYNQNKEGQVYYTTIYKKDIVGNIEPQRVELKLNKPGDLVITRNSNLKESGNQILINISTLTLYNKAYLCFKWSTHVITVSTIYTEISKLPRYNLFDKCYNMDRDITSESFVFPVNYKTFGVLDKNDFIKVVFIDSDCIDGTCLTYRLDEKNESVDVGATDIVYEIKNN